MNLKELFNNKHVLIMDFYKEGGKVDNPILTQMALKNGAKGVTLNKFFDYSNTINVADNYDFNKDYDIVLMSNMYAHMEELATNRKFGIAQYFNEQINNLTQLLRHNNPTIVFVQNDYRRVSGILNAFKEDPTVNTRLQNAKIISMFDDKTAESHLTDGLKVSNIIKADWLEYSVFTVSPTVYENPYTSKVYDFCYIGESRGKNRVEEVYGIVKALLDDNRKVFIAGSIVEDLYAKDSSLKDNPLFHTEKGYVDITRFNRVSKLTILPSEEGYGYFITKRFYEGISETVVMVAKNWDKSPIVTRYKTLMDNQVMYYSPQDVVKYLHYLDDNLATALNKRYAFYEIEKARLLNNK